MAALFHIGVNPFLFLCGHGPTGTGNDKDGCVIRHGWLFQQAEGADIVPLLEQDLSCGRQPRSLSIIETRFPVPFEKEHAFLAVLRDTDQGTCQLRFRGRVDPNALPGAFKHGRIGSGNAILLGDFRLPFRIDELHRNLRAGLSITIEPFFVGLVAGVLFSGKDGNGHLTRKAPQQAIRLGGKGEILILRQIPTNGVAGSQKIDNDKNADEKKDHQQTVRPYTRRAAGGEGFQTTDMGDNEHDEGEECRSSQEGYQPEFLRNKAIPDRSGSSQSQANHAEWNRLRGHFHRAESTTRCAKNSIKARLLKKYTRSFVSISPRTKWS